MVVILLTLVMMRAVLCVVSSGSVTINEDSSVQILAEEACSMDQLDAQVTHLYDPRTLGSIGIVAGGQLQPP